MKSNNTSAPSLSVQIEVIFVVPKVLKGCYSNPQKVLTQEETTYIAPDKYIEKHNQYRLVVEYGIPR